MGLEKIVKKTVRHVLIPLGLFIGVVSAYNYWQHHNVVYEANGKKVFQKADGILGYTNVEVEGENIEITRFHTFNYRSYDDFKGDDVVDRVSLGGIPFVRGSHFRSLEREKNFGENVSIFYEADEDFAHQKERFREYLAH